MLPAVRSARPCCGVRVRNTRYAAKTSHSCCSEKGIAVWASEMRRLLLRAASLALVLAALMLPPARGHASEIVSDVDIARARKSQSVITEQDIQRAQSGNRMPTEGELRAVPVPCPTPNIDRLPQPQEKKPLDLSAIARGYEGDRRSDRAGSGRRSRIAGFRELRVAAADADERLVEQAARAKATLVLRGFVNNSLPETVLRVQRLIGQRQVAFRRFTHRHSTGSRLPRRQALCWCARAAAQSKPCSSGQCFSTDAFVSTAGDVSLDYALEYIQRTTAPRFSREAAQFLKRMRD